MKERRGIGRKWGRNRSLKDANLECQVGGFISIGRPYAVHWNVACGIYYMYSLRDVCCICSLFLENKTEQKVY